MSDRFRIVESIPDKNGTVIIAIKKDERGLFNSKDEAMDFMYKFPHTCVTEQQTYYERNRLVSDYELDKLCDLVEVGKKHIWDDEICKIRSRSCNLNDVVDKALDLATALFDNGNYKGQTVRDILHKFRKEVCHE